MTLKKFVLSLAVAFLCAAPVCADEVKSPDGKMLVQVYQDGGHPTYSVTYDGKAVILPSPLGLRADLGDLTQGFTQKGVRRSSKDERYTLSRSKTSAAHYEANLMEVDFETADGLKLTVEVSVANHDIGLRYRLPQQKGHMIARIESEVTGYRLPEQTRTYLCPKTKPMTGWARCQPSYETDYVPDASLSERSQYGVGFTFPCLFRLGGDDWLLLSETGVRATYCASHLSDYDPARGYHIAYPDAGENNGVGLSGAQVNLPCSTPWRTLTVGHGLKPLVETTVQFDLVSPLYEPKIDYKPGTYTWSWLLWQDDSMNWGDQVKFVDLAALMGYEYVLVDALWLSKLGRDKMAELSRYAQGKGVSLLLWYNSNGGENDAPQDPRGRMNTAVEREQEMTWLESIGVKGIKVDFFGGDKQETMKLYEDILCDANRHGLQVIFHGCTLPRGWERMYPNFVASEAVLASENMYFEQAHCDREGFELTMHPFCRNTVGSMDWGGTVMNKRMARDNNSRHYRRTSDIFEMAAALMVQTSVNCVALYPNNLEELPQFEIDWLKTVPTTWEETRFIDGFPGQYAVLARRHEGHWYVTGLNGTPEVKKLTLSLPMLAGKTVIMLVDKPARKGGLPQGEKKTLKVGSDGRATIVMQPMGGLILTEME